MLSLRENDFLPEKYPRKIFILKVLFKYLGIEFCSRFSVVLVFRLSLGLIVMVAAVTLYLKHDNREIL